MHRRFAFVLVVLSILATAPARAIVVAPQPSVRFVQNPPPPDVPPETLIGEPFTFRVRFKNVLSSTTLTGYGPFIDLVLDAAGADPAKGCPCDGMTFLSASLISVNGGPVPLNAIPSLASPCSTLASPLAHPYAGVQPVMVPPGGQLVTIELPYGSFDPTEPEVVIEVTAQVSANADPGYPLKIAARGGFRYGADPLNNAPPDWPVLSDQIVGPNPPLNQQTDSTQWAAQAQTTPVVMMLTKKYLGPEDETATGPNFPRQYQITLDIAKGQMLSNVKVTDHLPNNLAFHQLVSVSNSCFTAPTPPPPLIDAPGNGNDLTLTCPSIVGAPGPDLTFVFSFFIPELDANGVPILSATSCTPAASVDDVVAEGDWTPSDPCDTPTHVVSDVTHFDHTLADKCLAIQKSVVDLNGGSPAHPIPGDTLQYTLSFQLSDFKTAGNLKIVDLISDGQSYVTGSATLTVSDQCGTTTGTIPASAITPIIACGLGSPPPHTQLAINVSAAMAALGTVPRHLAGILTGGWQLTPTTTVPALGKIVFQTKIDDAYQCPVPAGHDAFVDKDDPLRDTVTITADVLAKGGTCATTPAPLGFQATDGSEANLLIATDFLAKSIYAVKHGANQVCGPSTSPCPATPQVVPGDDVTYRLTKTIPSSDAENLTIRDWASKPKFDVTGMTFANGTCGIPAAGQSCLGPANTLALPSAFTFTADPATNSVKYDYTSFNDPANQPHTIDLLLTLKVTPAPEADALFNTNVAQECESNSYGTVFCQAAIAQVEIREPNLRVQKGIVAKDPTSAGYFVPGVVGPAPFNGPGGACPRFTAAITSAGLAVHPINSDLLNADANDCVTFAITVENTGGAPAYDIHLRDIFPLDPLDIPNCFSPDFSTLCVTDGAGSPIPNSGALGHGSHTINLQNPLPPANATGSNIAVITFDACVVGNIAPHCCDNVARLENYASVPGGPNFVDAGYGGPFQDSASICVTPKAAKSIVATSEGSTSANNVAIGEVVRFHIDLTIPESSAPNTYQLQDVLPAGLSYIGNLAVGPIPGGVIAQHGTTPLVTGATNTCNGGAVTFDFGTITNANNSNTPEIIPLEFNALVCNVAGNQDQTQRTNVVNVIVNGQQVSTSSATVVVVEPNIVIKKTAPPPPATVGSTVTYTLTLTNTGSSTAFDVHLTDHLPGCLSNLSNIQTSVTPAANASSALTLDLTFTSIAVGSPVTVTYSAKVNCDDCSQLTNTAKATWTSLPGPNGTTSNPTGSATPGASGTQTGERNGTGGVNDYVAFASASLCTVIVGNDSVSCTSGGTTFTETLTITNNTGFSINGYIFTPTSPSNITITPSSVPGVIAPGASITVTLTISGSGAVSGTTVCFDIRPGPLGIIFFPTNHCIVLPPCCVAPPSGMVAWYPLDETQGATSINDIAPPPSSLVNNAGTPLPGPVGAGGPIVVTGLVHGALYFASQFADVPSQNELNFNGGSFSVDGWIRVVNCNPGGLSVLVDKFDPNANSGYAFYANQPTPGTGVLHLRLNGATFTSTGAFPATAAPINNLGPWVHVAVTFDNGTHTGTFYINGTAAGTFTAPGGPASNAQSMWIGKTRVGSGVCELAIDELEIFNRALSAAEVKSISDAAAGGKCVSGQACITAFEDVNGNGVRDANEPVLTGFTFRVVDANNNLLGTTGGPIGTIPPPISCITIARPGTYTVIEEARDGWATTTGNSQTITVAPGQTVNVSFGNRVTKRRRVAK